MALDALLNSLLFLSLFFPCRREYLTLGLIIQANSIADSGILFDVVLTHSALEAACADSCLLPAAIFTVIITSSSTPRSPPLLFESISRVSHPRFFIRVRPLSDG